MAVVEQKQGEYLAQIAVAELDQQKNRLATYQVQARFALASMYDRAANPEPAKKPDEVAPAQKGGEEAPPGQSPDGAGQQPQSNSAAPARSNRRSLTPPPQANSHSPT